MKAAMTMAQRIAFWGMVKKEPGGGCWLWTGQVTEGGYGIVPNHIHRGNIRAHRLAWALAHDSKSPGRMMICHRCDNPTCVRPAHLFIGTAKDNCHDMLAKGRGAWQKRKPALDRTKPFWWL